MNQLTIQPSVIQLPTDPTIQDTIVQEKIVHDDQDKKPNQTKKRRTQTKKPNQTKKRKTHQEPTIQETIDKYGAEDEIDGKIDEQSSQETISEQPLNILQHFIFKNITHSVTIIQTDKGPMFKAADIGKILGINNMSHATSGFTDNQKGLVSNDTLGGPQKTLCLTVKGVYRVILRARKSIAWPFQEWVIDVIDEINKKGFYELKSAKEEAERYKEQANEAIKKADNAKHEAILEAFNHKYIVYYGHVKNIGDKKLIKIGSTQDIKDTNNRHLKDFGSFKLFFAIECSTNVKFEKFLHKHNFIKSFEYREACKVKEGKCSNEVFLMSDVDIERSIEVCKRNLSKFNEAPPDVQSLNGVLQNINEKSSTLLSNIEKMDGRIQNLEKSKRNPITEMQPFQEGKRHKANVTRGDKIQRYSPDGKTLTKTYPSLIEATRDPELGPNGCNKAIKDAIENNTIYKRYRWASLTRDKPDNEFQQIEPTCEDAIQVNTGFVAMLNLKKDKIVAVFADQKAAGKDRNFKGGAAICKALRQETQSGGHYFKLWHECSPDLRNKYLEENNLPEVVTSSGMKSIIQIGADGTEKKYANITQVTKQFCIGRKTLFDAIKHEYLLQGFKWKFAE